MNGYNDKKKPSTSHSIGKQTDFLVIMMFTQMVIILEIKSAVSLSSDLYGPHMSWYILCKAPSVHAPKKKNPRKLTYVFSRPHFCPDGVISAPHNSLTGSWAPE